MQLAVTLRSGVLFFGGASERDTREALVGRGRTEKRTPDTITARVVCR